jgi:uncharacterized protein (UPF0332 family)
LPTPTCWRRRQAGTAASIGLYYACFYAVSALLLRHGLSSSKHTGVLGLFNRELVRTGRVSAELGALYNTLFRSRQSGDYEDRVSFEPAQVQAWRPQAQAFVAAIERLLAAPPDGALAL